jgi:hypothetical protein
MERALDTVGAVGTVGRPHWETSMARSIRVLYRGVQGRVRRNFNWPPITEKSAVVITAAEYRLSGGIFGTDGRPLLGEANVYVTNIGPHDPEVVG